MENNLKVWRAKHDLTQQDLADEMDVARQTINAIECGRYDPSLTLAFKLAEYFDCTVEDIFTHEPE